MRLTRRQDWEQRLTAWIDGAQSRAFVWGAWDCTLAMASAVEAMTGVDIAAEWRGRCSDARSAVQVVCRATGIARFEDAIASILRAAGLEECPVAYARRGDVVMGDQPDGATWGVIDLTGRRALYAAKSGLLWAPVLRARRAWRVG